MGRIAIEKMPEVEFVNQKHLQRYVKFINSRPERDLVKNGKYFNIHHIVPRALCGSDKNQNLIKLTHREHYIAHMILWKAYSGKMAQAFWNMSNCNDEILQLSSKQYEKLRKDFCSEQMGKVCINNGTIIKFICKDENLPVGFQYGTCYEMSEESRQKLSVHTSSLVWVTNGINSYRIDASSCIPEGFCFGKTEVKKCNRDHSSGKTWYNNGQKNIYLTENEIVPEGFIKGFVCEREERYDKGRQRLFINNGVENRFILKEDYIFYKDWTPGKINITYKDKEKKTWINNGIIQYMINVTDIIPDGWSYGMCNKKKTTKKDVERVWINDGVHNKHIPIYFSIPSGYVYGKIVNKKDKLSIKKYVVNNGTIQIKIPFDTDIPFGFVKGGLKRCRKQ